MVANSLACQLEGSHSEVLAWFLVVNMGNLFIIVNHHQNQAQLDNLLLIILDKRNTMDSKHVFIVTADYLMLGTKWVWINKVPLYITV